MMKQYPLINSRVSQIAFGLFLTAMLFLSRDTLFSSCLMGFAKSQILMMGLIVLLGVVFLWVNRRSFFQILKDPRMIVLLLSSLVFTVPMVLKQDWQLMYLSILLCVLTAIFLTFFTNIREVAKYYVVILTVLGFYSLIATYGLKYLAGEEIINPTSFRNSNRWLFYNFVFAYAMPSYHWYRNFGIFREPGVFQFFILLAAYLNNYHVDWDKQRKLWICNVILAFTMLSTFAIGGFAEFGLLIIFLFFDKKWYHEKWGKRAVFVAMVAIVGFFACFFYFLSRPEFGRTVFYEFYDMFIRLTTDSESMMDRKNAIITNIQFIKQNPLVGEVFAKVLHGTKHNTSSTLLLYAALGVAGGTLNVASWIALLWKRKRNVFGNLFLLLILFMSFNTQNLVANVFFWLFPMMALVERGLPLLKRSN